MIVQLPFELKDAKTLQLLKNFILLIIQDIFHFYTSKVRRVEMTVAEFLDNFSSPKRSTNYYIAQQDIKTTFPELLPYIRRPSFDKMMVFEKANFWMGSGGQVTPLHFDDTENLMVLLSGEKTFTLFPPNQAKFLYPRQPDKVSGYRTYTTKVDINNPNYDIFPLFKNATRFTVTIRQGPHIFISLFVSC
jgi:hypothetical protein